MKKLHLFLFLGLISLFAVGCERDSREMKSFSSFIVETPSLSSDEKAVFDFDGRNIIYEEGDIIYVSGDDQTNVPFTLHREGNETDGYRWVAQGSEVVHGSTFYWCYVSNNGNTAPSYNSAKHSYSVNLDDGAGAPVTTGIVMAGNTETNILTTSPSFAILYFTSAQVNSYSSIKVGFEANAVPKIFSISAEDGSFADIEHFRAASSENVHSMLTMKSMGDYFYVAVPINGESVATKLYFEYTKNGHPYQRVTSGRVTLTKGKIIRIPSEDMSNYPFDVNGAGKYKFSVADGRYVRFSAGNLWFHPYKYSVGDNTPQTWIFTTPQYNMHFAPEDNLINGDPYHGNYIDLFAWGTSGADGFPSPLATSTEPTAYGDGGANMTEALDWGYNYSLGCPGIYYGSGRTSLSWRTLTIAEWQYLLGNSATRDGKWGYARIKKENDTYVYGLIILPDSYDLDDDLAVSPNTLNERTLREWSIMESDGAIFLPACGAINSDRDEVYDINTAGYYWSATASDKFSAKAIYFVSKGSRSINTNAIIDYPQGLSVRLVTENGAAAAH